jgi:hypothetical protein
MTKELVVMEEMDGGKKPTRNCARLLRYRVQQKPFFNVIKIKICL